MYRTRSERGQMVVIVGLALTILVSMVGVVIDGGMALSNRRQVQNAADAASLAGTRVLGLDVRWRATGRPNPPGAPFGANADDAVCDAINAALGYDENSSQQIDTIDCYVGSPDAEYVGLDANNNIITVGIVGQGIPLNAQGVRVHATGHSDTLLMKVVGIDTLDIAGQASAISGPAEPPVGKLMPFVVQNPLQPFAPGSKYEVRSESEGECGTAAIDESLHLARVGTDSIVLAMATGPDLDQPILLGAQTKPLTPEASPPSQTFLASVQVTLTSPTVFAKIYYTIDGTTPTASSTEFKNNDVLTFTQTTTLQAVAVKNGEVSDVGAFTYTKAEPPPEAVTASPPSGTTFATTQSVTLMTATSGALIHYTTDGSTPTASSPIYSGSFTLSASTVVKAVAIKNLSSSAVSQFTYTKNGDVMPPIATPPSGTEFQSGLTVTLSTTTSGATIRYTLDGTDPTSSSPAYTSGIVLTATTTIKAFAMLSGSADSGIVSFTYTLNGPTCPDSTAGNFGWIDFSGGAGGNNELKSWVDDPSTAPGGWYYRNCTGPADMNCRDQHNVADTADDHWLVEGTSGHRDVSMELACKYVDQEIYVPIWDSFATFNKKPNGANAVFHIIGFAVFKLDGIIDVKNNGDPSGKGCGIQDIDGVSGANEKGFVGTYVDSFIGSQVARCIIDPVTQNPCTNLNANTSFTINLSE
jgi:hypothetical protein